MRIWWRLLFFPFLFCFAAQAQSPLTIRGEVKDSVGQALQGVTVSLITGADTLFFLTNKEGAFAFSKNIKDSFTLRASYTGLQPFLASYARPTGTAMRIPAIQLLPSGGEMEEIVIKSVRPVVIKEDTVQYDASAYKVREGAPVEDVIKKLPGVTVDKDGNIEAQGKKIARVRVNGKDFFGGDVQTATQNLPADIIQNIQIIDDYGDEANISGNKSGEPEKIININTQPDKRKGYFGNATIAGGNQGRYAGNVFFNRFNNEQQISVLGAVNNTNANLFNFNGGGRGGGARGANFGSDSRGGQGGSGITLSKSAGFNFRDKWGEKISVYGSYSFSARNTTVNSTTFSQDINPKNVRNTLRESLSRNQNTNHRATLNLEYRLDSFNYFKFSPYLSYSESGGESISQSELSRLNYTTINRSASSSDNRSPNGGGNLVYNHRFQRRGRNLSTSINLDFSDNDAMRYSNSAYRNIDSTGGIIRTRDTLQLQSFGTESRNSRTNMRLSYNEPLNASGSTVLELNYDYNLSSTESIRRVTDFLDSADKSGRFNERQSNHFRYQFTTNRAGIGIRGRHEKYNYSVGFQSQPTRLSGKSVGKDVNTTYRNINWVPSLRFVYNFARNHSLTATADGAAREPSFMQLQPIADSSNLNNIVVGNPDLINEFTNTFALRYNKFDSKEGSSLFINLSYHQTSDKIVSSRFNEASGTRRTTTYTNTDGFHGYNGNASFNQPFSNRRYVAGISLSGNYDNNISFTDGLKNKGSNWNLRPGASFRVDLDKKVDVTFRADYTAFQTTTRYVEFTRTNKAQTLNYGVNGRNYFGDLTVGYDYSKLVNYGFNGNVASNPSILNVFLEYRMLKGKMMTLRLQGFDLFDKNTGIVRTINETTITDSRTNRLGRYFLLTANVRLAKFAGGSAGRRNQQDRRRNMD